MNCFKSIGKVNHFTKVFTVVYLVTLPLVFVSLYVFNSIFSYTITENRYIHLGLSLLEYYIPALFGIIFAAYILKLKLTPIRLLFFSLASFVFSLPAGAFLSTSISNFIVFLVSFLDLLFPNWSFIEISGYFTILVITMPVSILLSSRIADCVKQRIKKTLTTRESMFIQFSLFLVLLIIFEYFYLNPPEFINIAMPKGEEGVIAGIWIYTSFPMEIAIISLLFLRGSFESRNLSLKSQGSKTKGS